MANLLETGAAWLADQLKAHASVEVVYQRGADQVTVAATIGKTEFEIDDGSGAIVRFQSRDYLIHAADLILAGSKTLPIAGDLIRESVGSQTFVYEVLSPGNAPPWRYSDPFRQLLRVHTKQVATVGPYHSRIGNCDDHGRIGAPGAGDDGVAGRGAEVVPQSGRIVRAMLDRAEQPARSPKQRRCFGTPNTAKPSVAVRGRVERPTIVENAAFGLSTSRATRPSNGWSERPRRFAAMGAWTRHFQTKYGRDRPAGRWYVYNNNSPQRIDEYPNEGYRRLHLASGKWFRSDEDARR